MRRRLLTRPPAAAADWLERREQLGRDVFRRGQAGDATTVRAGRSEPSHGRPPVESLRRGGDVTALLRACLAAIRLPADAAGRFRAPAPPFWSPADAAARIRASLPTLGEGGAPLAAFLPDVPAGWWTASGGAGRRSRARLGPAWM